MRKRPALLMRIGWPLVAAVILTLVVASTPASASHGGAHTVVFYSLTCYLQNDPSGDDEPYLKLNGSRIWENPDCLPVHTYDLGGMSRSFWNETDLYIMEDDFGSDDTVGYVRLGPQAGQGVQVYRSYKWLDNFGWHVNYELTYLVI